MTAPASERRALPTRRESRRLGESLARILGPGDLALFDGAVGAGKTFVVRALARALGVSGRITSPTFTLVNEYETRQGTLVHADFYRLQGDRLVEEVLRLGLRERRTEGALLVVEWGEAALGALGGSPSFTVTMTVGAGGERAAAVQGAPALEFPPAERRLAITREGRR